MFWEKRWINVFRDKKKKETEMPGCHEIPK